MGQANLAVTITGQGSQFVQGTSQVSFGSDITVNNLTVASATSLTASISIPATATPGLHTLAVTTGTEIDSLANAFSVTGGTPVITQVNPNAGQQGQQNLSVAITGQFTNWVQGTTTASFGTGITVVSLTVTTPTSATAVINIAPTAIVGPYTVTLTTGGEIDTLTNGFTVAAGTPVITQVNPNTGQEGQRNLSVTITGQFTHFAQGTSQVSFGAGITVGSVTVVDATILTAQITISINAPLGPQTATVTTGTEVASLSGGFTVTPANIFVEDRTGNSILEYDASGAFVGTFVPPGSGGLQAPGNIVFGPDGNLYVSTDVTQSAILRYNGQTGAFIDTFVPAGSGGRYYSAE